jgi:hypothetical protein
MPQLGQLCSSTVVVVFVEVVDMMVFLDGSVMVITEDIAAYVLLVFEYE